MILSPCRQSMPFPLGAKSDKNSTRRKQLVYSPFSPIYRTIKTETFLHDISSHSDFIKPLYLSHFQLGHVTKRECLHNTRSCQLRYFDLPHRFRSLISSPLFAFRLRSIFGGVKERCHNRYFSCFDASRKEEKKNQCERMIE